MSNLGRSEQRAGRETGEAWSGEGGRAPRLPGVLAGSLLRGCVGASAIVILAAFLTTTAAWAWPAAGGDTGTLAALSRLGGAPVFDGLSLHAFGPRRRTRQRGIALRPSKVEPHWACPDERCEAIIEPPPVRTRSARWEPASGGAAYEGSGEQGGLDPQDLQSAYALPSSGGPESTVAVIDAYGYSAAEKDLAKYRKRYGLPACTKANGCFQKVNESGEEANYPPNRESWEGESALDIEMVSAACPSCHIMLVEASSNEGSYLAEAVNTAVRLGASEVSNSYGSPEEECWEAGIDACEAEGENADYDHPGVFITASAGDSGYDNHLQGAFSPSYPAALPYVVSVGGTALHKEGNSRGWSEEVWNEPSRPAGSGGGCSRFTKPTWQSDSACHGRIDNDTAAVAACSTPVSVYGVDGWELICGTSVSSPLLAAIEAHASAYALSLPGADAFYENPAHLNDVTKGANGVCTPPTADAYFCQAGAGYDGPTGEGSPAGPLSITGAYPLAETRPAATASETSATLAGEVGPQGLESSYHFEYGTSTTYGTDVPVPDAAAGTGTAAVPVSAHVEALNPNSTYHYRLVATNAAGTTYGQDASFHTAPPTVSALEPPTGPRDGGGTVTISGANFAGTTAVSFGANAATSFTVNDESSITATAPAGSETVDVTVTTPAGTSQTSSADRYTYAVPPTALLSWGGSEGALGNGSQGNSDSPVEVSGIPEAIGLAAGAGHSLALLKDGRVMAWGRNFYGEVGDGSYRLASLPVPVCAVGIRECSNGPYLEHVSALAAENEGSLALLNNGTVVQWGATGLEPEESKVPTPVCIKLEAHCKPENYLKEVTAIAGGAFFGLALLRDGKILTWGSNLYGELGNGGTSGPESCGEAKHGCSRIPIPVAGLEDVTAIAAGSNHSLALLANGTVMAWGQGSSGELGDGTQPASSVPVPVCGAGEAAPCSKLLEGATAVSAGSHFSAALLHNGTVVSWGANGAGELGDGSLTASDVPVAVSNLSEVRALAAGEHSGNTLAVLENGTLVSWGENADGELGDGTELNSDEPVEVCAPPASGPCPAGPALTGAVSAIAVGGEHALISISTTPQPHVLQLQPNSGAASGGTQVRILGTNLDAASAVHFGANAAPGFQIDSDDEITASSPAGSGLVDVTVTSPEGTSATGTADQFTYQGPPNVSAGSTSAVGLTSATLEGSVNPDGLALEECAFEYGETTAYGTTTQCSSLPGSGTEAVVVSAHLNGLEKNTTYYFRLVARNRDGTGTGAQSTFTTPSALLPEIGRCSKLGKDRGDYKNSKCTSASAAPGEGSFEWQPWPLANEGFSSTGGTATFETRGPSSITGKPLVISCHESRMTGAPSGSQTIAATLTLTGCESDVLATQEPCQSQDATPGEIQLGPLEGELGWENEPKDKVALDLYPPTGSFPEFECAPPSASHGYAVHWRGSVLVPVSADKMTASIALKFKATKGIQRPEAFEGSPIDVLERSQFEEPFEKMGLTLTTTLGFEEALEIKAMP